MCMFDLSQFPLPYDMAALAPYMSERTLEFHHGRHLATYIKNLNGLIDGTDYAAMPLLGIIRQSHAHGDTGVFNNAAQVFNHDFFFHCLAPNGGGAVPAAIADAFGGPDAFRNAFKTAATSVFGSGWTWIVRDGDDLRIIKTANADTPVANGMRPALCLDVWEHAYYLDYQNRRADFCDAFLDHMVNWDFVLENI